jgi:hypothetical protein
MADGRLLYRLKHRWRDGTTHVVFEPGELVEKLAALTPPPRFHLVRYHGVLGPCASQRGRVVPRPEPRGEATDVPDSGLAAASGKGRAMTSRSGPADGGAPRGLGESQAAVPRGALPGLGDGDLSSPGGKDASERLAPADELPLRPRRLAWADLLRRVFTVDVLECPRCGARTRLLAAIHPPDATSAILKCLDLPARAPPVEAARPEEDAWEPLFADEGA